MKYDVLIYGPVFCDLIFTDLPGFPALGKEVFAGDLTVSVGGSAIVAAGLNNLGVRVGLIADLGNDPFSTTALELLQKIHLDCSLIRRLPYPLQRTTVALSYPSDRAFITRFVNPETPPELNAICHAYPAKHLHICSILAALETPEICHLAHAAGMSVSFDPGWDEQAILHPHIAEIINECDVFMPSRSELCYIAQSEDVEQAATKIASTMTRGMMVIKNGSLGASAYLNNEQKWFHIPALPVKPVDTTGAGDAFDAGFLSAFIKGAPLEVCMQYGVVCGGLSTTARGGVTAIPKSEDMTQWLLKLQS